MKLSRRDHPLNFPRSPAWVGATVGDAYGGRPTIDHGGGASRGGPRARPLGRHRRAVHMAASREDPWTISDRISRQLAPALTGLEFCEPGEMADPSTYAARTMEALETSRAASRFDQDYRTLSAPSRVGSRFVRTARRLTVSEHAPRRLADLVTAKRDLGPTRGSRSSRTPSPRRPRSPARRFDRPHSPPPSPRPPPRRVSAKAVDALPAGPPRRAHRRPQPRHQRRAGAEQRRPGGRGSRARWRRA